MKGGITSGGVTSGIHMVLHIVRRFLGESRSGRNRV